MNTLNTQINTSILNNFTNLESIFNYKKLSNPVDVVNFNQKALSVIQSSNYQNKFNSLESIDFIGKRLSNIFLKQYLNRLYVDGISNNLEFGVKNLNLTNNPNFEIQENVHGNLETILFDSTKIDEELHIDIIFNSIIENLELLKNKFSRERTYSIILSKNIKNILYGNREIFTPKYADRETGNIIQHLGHLTIPETKKVNVYLNNDEKMNLNQHIIFVSNENNPLTFFDYNLVDEIKEYKPNEVTISSRFAIHDFNAIIKPYLTVFYNI
jgi:hypothetical protein